MRARTADGSRRPPGSGRLRLVRTHLRLYAAINAGAYGLFVVGFLLGLVVPELSADRAQSLEDDGTGALVRRLVETPPLFAATILGVNVVRLGLMTIVLPSLVIPFAGLVAFAWWSVQTGITLVPAAPAGWVALIPHSLTVLIELQAYVLLLLGAALLGRAWVQPASVAAGTRREAYLRGLQHLGRLATAAVCLLVVGAVWEAVSLRYLVRPLQLMLL